MVEEQHRICGINLKISIIFTKGRVGFRNKNRNMFYTLFVERRIGQGMVNLN